MITPAGKRRFQVNQGGTKHETIFNSDIFKGLTKEALAPMTNDQPKSDPQSDQGGSNEMGGRLQSVMNDSKSRLNQNPPGADSGTKPSQPQQADPTGQRPRFDSMTGEPLMGVDGTKLVMMLREWLASNQETSDLKIQGFTEKGGSYTVTFGPQGKMVTKGNN